MGENLLRSELAIHTQHLVHAALQAAEKPRHEYPLTNVGNLFCGQRLAILARLLNLRRVVGLNSLRALFAIHGHNVFRVTRFPLAANE